MQNEDLHDSFVCFWRDSPQWARTFSFTRFLDHTQRRSTVGRTPLDECSARRRNLCLTTNNNHSRQTSMSPVGFEPTLWANERPQTHVLDRAATGTGLMKYGFNKQRHVWKCSLLLYVDFYCILTKSVRDSLNCAESNKSGRLRYSSVLLGGYFQVDVTKQDAAFGTSGTFHLRS